MVRRFVYIKTFGCSFNRFDSFLIRRYLQISDFSVVERPEDADFVILNSCSVKNSAEAKLFNDLNRFCAMGKRIVVAGCVPQAEPSYLNTKFREIPVIGTNNLSDIVEVIESLERGVILHRVSEVYPKNLCRFNRISEGISLLEDGFKSSFKSFILPINEGCLGSCSFCKTKFARGNLKSYPINEIKVLFKKYVDLGAKEIFLTSQDTACYGLDIGTDLPSLLTELLTVPGDYKIRIGMGNPNFFIPIIERVLDIMSKSDKIYRFLHIPVQSGSNRILKLMNRMYTVEDYKKIIDSCREKIPLITIANDLIVGFPTETESDFKETIEVMKYGGTDVLNFSRFWLRPNTPISRLVKDEDFIPGLEAKKRVVKLKSEFEEIAVEQNKKWIGWRGEVLITEKGKKGTFSLIGRNIFYKHIVLKFNSNEEMMKYSLGDKVIAEIDEVTWFDFRGRVIKKIY